MPSQRCDGCDDVKSEACIEAVQMTIGRGMTPPEYAYLCRDCRAKLKEQNGKQSRAEREAGI